MAAIVAQRRAMLNEFGLCARGAQAEVMGAAGSALNTRTMSESVTYETPAQATAADKRRRARDLYWQGWRISSIAEHIGEPRSTVHGWKEAEKWDAAQPIQRVEGALESRLVQLIAKDQKTGGDFKEIDLLGRQVERLARVRNYEKTGKEKELNPNIERRNAGPKRSASPDKNHFDEDAVEKVERRVQGLAVRVPEGVVPQRA